MKVISLFINPRYVILNVQKDVSEDNVTKYVYREVGSWDNIYKLNLNMDVVRFPNESRNYTSVCSEGCAFGHVKQIKQGGMKCCWNCKKCDEHAYVLDEFTCQDCVLGFWPSKNLTSKSILLSCHPVFHSGRF